jgi:hypothetical protein
VARKSGWGISGEKVIRRKGYQESRVTGQQENGEVRIKNGFGIKACPEPIRLGSG